MSTAEMVVNHGVNHGVNDLGGGQKLTKILSTEKCKFKLYEMGIYGFRGKPTNDSAEMLTPLDGNQFLSCFFQLASPESSPFLLKPRIGFGTETLNFLPKHFWVRLLKLWFLVCDLDCFNPGF